MDKKDFYTFREYMKKENSLLTASMEDYIEMIYRLSFTRGFTRIHELSAALNVQPPSATRMVQRLAKLNFLEYEKYGVVILKEDGIKMGALLLKRHDTIEAFLRLIEIPEEVILKETEMIEHTISAETLQCLESYINFLKVHPEILIEYTKYKNSKNNN